MPPVPTASVRLPDRYRVLRHIANGGMASVWQASDEVLRREVAVKVLASHLTADDTARVRFQREARAAAGLSGHPHVVTIYDVGEFEGRSFIVMELMRGSIADVLRDGAAVLANKALRWLREAGSALDAAHQAGIVHRDVKPANMLLDQRERLALADFGIARLAFEAQLTATGTVLGTSTYISPEQALGHPATTASDRYALAAVAFELLTGTRPFPAEHFAAQARAHIEDPPPAASERHAGLDPAVDPVLQRGMAKDPDARWATAGEFVEALAAGLSPPAASAATHAVAPAPVPQGERTDMMPVAVPRGAGRRPPSRPREPARERPQRRWGIVALASGVLVLAAVAVALVLTSGGGGEPDPARTPRAQRPEPTPTPERTPGPSRSTPEPTATATPETTPSPEPTPSPQPEGPQPDPAAAAALNTEGFALFQAGNYEQALAPLQRAYELCQGSTQLDPCGYATFNYGAALNRSGNSEAAVPILEERMTRFGDNDQGDVAGELDSARKGEPGRGAKARRG